MSDPNGSFGEADEVFTYMEGFTNLERGKFNPREYRLERMQRLLCDFGDPHLAYDVIHVAGSKGKGSVSAFAARCAAAAGRTVGLYMSPHVSSYRERISLIGAGTSDEERDSLVVRTGETIARYVEAERNRKANETLPTTFELLTLLAFLLFREAGCNLCVVEVGLGGRLDATNLVQPRVCVITPVELEHTDYLGDSVAAVAREKGGIIKAGVPLVLTGQQPDAEQVLVSIAAERGCEVVHVSENVNVRVGKTADSGTEVSFHFADGVALSTRLRMLGSIQAMNAAAAALAVRLAVPDITPQQIATGLARTWLPGRAELWPGNPQILLDGAHTPASIRTVLEIADLLEPRPTHRLLIYGSVAGKQYRSMLEMLVGRFSQIIISRPGTFKASNTAELFETCTALGGLCTLKEEMEEALAVARAAASDGGGTLIVVTGSFHLVGAARKCLQEVVE